MTRCDQCGARTGLDRDGSPLCYTCDDKAGAAAGRITITELNARLNVARDDYRRAMGAQRAALEFQRTLDPNNPDGSMAMQNANFQVELASTQFREALRRFVRALARRAE